MAAKFVAWRYTDNLGQHWLIRAKKEIVAQATGGTNSDVLVGGREATANDHLEPIPNGFRPRGVYVTKADGTTRKVVCYTFDAPLMTGTPPPGDVLGDATHITLRDALGATASYARQKPIEERHERLGVHTVA